MRIVAATEPPKPEGRWVILLALAGITNVGYGTLLYAFGVLLGEDAAAEEFGRALLSGALGLAVVVSGALAPVVGTLCDVAGSRWVFFAGAVLGSAGLAAFSRATSGWQVLATWALLAGPAMACVFYEPAYVTVDQWFARQDSGVAHHGARHFGGPLYGRLMGLQSALLALATAGGPLAAGVLRDVSGSYTLLAPAAIALLLLAVPTVLAAEGGGRSGT